jgi:hypothetical protein
MATSGYSAKFGKGYLGGGKEAAAPAQEAGPEGEEGGDGEIKSHLEQMHAKTGSAHSHVHHHGDGNHTVHHISAEGQHSGPEESGDCPGGMCGGGM